MLEKQESVISDIPLACRAAHDMQAKERADVLSGRFPAAQMQRSGNRLKAVAEQIISDIESERQKVAIENERRRAESANRKNGPEKGSAKPGAPHEPPSVQVQPRAEIPKTEAVLSEPEAMDVDEAGPGKSSVVDTGRYRRLSFDNAQRYISLCKQTESAANIEDKRLSLDIKMRVNKRVSQVTALESQIALCASDLTSLLAGLSSNAPHLSYVLVQIATKAIDQAETQLAPHPASAYPLAKMLIAVSQSCADVFSVLLGKIFLSCPICIPFYAPSIDTNVLSDYSRAKGIVALYAALISFNSPMYPLVNGWTFVASLLNLEPRAITPFVLDQFLQTCGHYLLAFRNFTTLLLFVKHDYCNRISPSAVAGKTRLEILIDATLSGRGLCEKPPGGP